MKVVKICDNCEFQCPFCDENGLGNCELDMKEIKGNDTCEKWKRRRK